MYSMNLENKSLILACKKPQKLFKEFYTIHPAKLTGSIDRNTSFESFSNIYLDTYQQLRTSLKESLIINDNKSINSFIACQKKTCFGPNPRIKKLLISIN